MSIGTVSISAEAQTVDCPLCCEHRRFFYMRRLLDLSFDHIVDPILDHVLLEQRRYIYLIPRIVYRRVCVLRARPFVQENQHDDVSDGDDGNDTSAPTDFVDLFFFTRNFLHRSTLLSSSK